MKTTEENKTLIKNFLRVLQCIGMSQDTAVFITMMLETKEQMDELVMFIQNNPKATEMETLEKAKLIVDQKDQIKRSSFRR